MSFWMDNNYYIGHRIVEQNLNGVMLKEGRGERLRRNPA